MDRFDAGQKLAKALTSIPIDNDAIILALPRGGVPVAYVIASKLSLPLDVFLVRKLGVPNYSELAMGAIASGDITYFNKSVIKNLNIPQKAIDEVIKNESEELKRREKIYRGNNPFPDLKNRTVILVDDGIATGATAKAAIKAIKKRHPKEIILAVPVAAQESIQEIQPEVDCVVCPLTPTSFGAVGYWYENFPQTTDEEVCDFLAKAKNHGS